VTVRRDLEEPAVPERTTSTTSKQPSPTSSLDRYFRMSERRSDPRTESIAGATTFLAMAYIVFVNPGILADAGMDPGAVFVATCLAAALGTLVMGLWANLPIAQAPGMGLNAFFAYTVVLTFGIPWETALAGTFVSGLLFLILAVTGVRGAIINAIPHQLKMAVGAGIGLFIAFIGLKAAGIVVPDSTTIETGGAAGTVVTLGDLGASTTLLAIFGLLVTGFFLMRGLRGAVFYGILATAVGGMLVGLIDVPSTIIATPPSLAPTFGAAFGAFSELFTLEMALVVFTMLFVDFFDTAGTLIAVTNQAGLLEKDGSLPGGNRPLVSDAIATMGGATLGTSTTTSYIESAAGVGSGGRTGFSSVVTAGLFLLALLFSPLLGIVTAEVTAAALIVVGVMMARGLGEIEWTKLEYAIPAFVTVVAMPLTYSIANGIALGLVLFPVMMVFKGRARDVHPIMYGLVVVFLIFFVFLIE
jgi:adenine/guanine/hypoxanthine permease